MVDDAATRTEPLLLELRRGVIVLAVLSQLSEARYGYSLRRQLAEHGFEVNEGTLYPLLRRLEAQGLLESTWQLGEGRPRRYYHLAATGHQVLAALRQEWQELQLALADLLPSERTDHGSD